jgi:hypothetical protein
VRPDTGMRPDTTNVLVDEDDVPNCVAGGSGTSSSLSLSELLLLVFTSDKQLIADVDDLV